jgi:hypothetical protein
MPATSQKDLIDRLAETAIECRALIREMHEAQQSLKAEIREARSLQSEFIGQVGATVDRGIDQAEGEIKEWIDQTNKELRQLAHTTLDVESAIRVKLRQCDMAIDNYLVMLGQEAKGEGWTIGEKIDLEAE